MWVIRSFDYLKRPKNGNLFEYGTKVNVDVGIDEVLCH
jgi:hypothetical protein